MSGREKETESETINIKTGLRGGGHCLSRASEAFEFKHAGSSLSANQKPAPPAEQHASSVLMMS